LPRLIVASCVVAITDLISSTPELPDSFGDHCVSDSVRVMREPGYPANQRRKYAATALADLVARQGELADEWYAGDGDETGIKSVDDATINRLVDKDGANPVGPLVKATAFDQVELAVEYISDVYNTQAMSIFVAPEMHRAYMKDKRSNGFYQITDPNQINNGVDFTQHKVIGLPSMAGTTDMWFKSAMSAPLTADVLSKK